MDEPQENRNKNAIYLAGQSVITRPASRWDTLFRLINDADGPKETDRDRRSLTGTRINGSRERDRRRQKVADGYT